MDAGLKRTLMKASAEESYAKTMGFKLLDVDTGFARVEMAFIPQQMNNLFGTAHGGAIFSLMDEAFQISCQTHGTMAVALNVNVTYMASPIAPTVLWAVSREINKTRKTASYDIKVTDAENRLIAACQALAYRTGKPLPF